MERVSGYVNVNRWRERVLTWLLRIPTCISPFIYKIDLDSNIRYQLLMNIPKTVHNIRFVVIMVLILVSLLSIVHCPLLFLSNLFGNNLLLKMVTPVFVPLTDLRYKKKTFSYNYVHILLYARVFSVGSIETK